MTSTTCAGLDAKALMERRQLYDELFGWALGWYNRYAHKYIYQVLCLIGVFANVCIVLVLLRPQMRKNPFNLFLIAIAICDMVLMASYFVFKWVEMCHPWYFEYWWIVFTYSYAVLSVFVHSASLWMTVNMAVLRFLVLRNSANSSVRKMNSYSTASVCIVLAVIVSLIGSAPNMLRYEIRDNGLSMVPSFCLRNESAYASYYTAAQQVSAYTLGQPPFWNCTWETFSFWTAGLVLKLVPCLLLTVFMTLLVRMLLEARRRRLRLMMSSKRGSTATLQTKTTNGRNSLTDAPLSASNDTVSANGNGLMKNGGGTMVAVSNNATTNSTMLTAKKEGGGGAASSAERTTAMLTIIVAVFLVTELPQGILVMTIGVQPQLGNLIDLLSLLNSSVNFILYSTMSNQFRQEFLQTFGQCCSCVCRQRQRLFGTVGGGIPGGKPKQLANRAAAERSAVTSIAPDGSEKSVTHNMLLPLRHSFGSGGAAAD